MKPTSRLYSCLRCHTQVVICSPCDRGQIYCAGTCSAAARLQSCRAAEKRYQSTLRGKMNHALRQRRYRARLKIKVTDQGSLPSTQDAPINSLKNKPAKTENGQKEVEFICSFCKKPISAWLRNGFLRRREHKKHPGLQACSQAP
jgi:hypothetical protein